MLTGHYVTAPDHDVAGPFSLGGAWDHLRTVHGITPENSTAMIVLPGHMVLAVDGNLNRQVIIDYVKAGV